MITEAETLLLRAINRVRLHKHQPVLTRIDDGMRLREDCGFDSMDLAELTVIVEERTGVDLFADGPVRTVGEAVAKIVKPGKLTERDSALKPGRAERSHQRCGPETKWSG